MRLSYFLYLLPGLAMGFPFADSGTVLGGEKRESPAGGSGSQELTNSATSVEPVSKRRIDWKIVKGGLKVARDVIVVAHAATGATATILSWVQRDSRKNSCAPIFGSGESDNGKQKYHFKYWVTTTGKNCDTTAQTKTIAAAVDDAWDQVHKYKYDWACISMSHGGTWHGHIAVATVNSGKDVNKACD